MTAPEHFDRFFGDPKPKDIPPEPTHCTNAKCRAELPALRRWGGLCARCVRAKMRPALAPTAGLKSRFRVVRRFTCKRPDGKLERYLELECRGLPGMKCGRRREIKASTWLHHRPRYCSACKLREIDAHGFEAEKHGR